MARLVELTEGALFGEFRVVRKLGEGGMGAVYVVTQLATGRKRAMKLMHPELVVNAELREKFMQEARIGARIESEHVVDVVGAGVEPATGIPWLAMELLHGEDLAALVARRGRLEIGEVSAILEQLCHAVAAAHAAGIVHRDLKPENVFLASTKRAGDPFAVKVLDFGIAKLVEEARTSANTGMFGSPFWMAPEQTERDSVITPATDVWAIGLVVYKLLTGRLFWATAASGTGITAFLRELVIEPLPSATERATEQGVAQHLPAGFDAWFARCVVRDQRSRFRDAREAFTAFAPLLAGRAARLPSITVITSDTGPVTIAHEATTQSSPNKTALGSARTLPDPKSFPRVDPGDGDEADVRASGVPTRGGRAAVYAIVGGGAALALAAIVAVVAYRSESDPAPAPPSSSARGATPAPEVRCPSSMVPIAAGTFTMGATDGEADERPPHSVTLNAFCIDVTEVTVAEYARCVESKACTPASSTVEWKGISPEDKALWSAACNAGHPERQEHPINCVTFDQADAYCRAQKKRLPTEEEWEYVARGPDERVYPWGNEPTNASRANACGEECASRRAFADLGYRALFAGSDGWEETAPVRSFGAGKTPTGVYDLVGNVWEWTASRYCPYPGNNCASEWRVARGGAWNSDAREDPRASRRDKNAPDARASDLGLRCVR